MRTRTVFSVAAALALATAAGCSNCGPVTPAQTVVVAAPAQVVAAAPAAQAVYRPNRWHLRRRCDQPIAHPVNHCCLCGAPVAVAAPAVVSAPVAVTPVVVRAEPGVLVVQPAKKDAAGRTVTVLQRGRKGRILCSEGNITVVRPGTAVVAAVPMTVVSEPAAVGPVVIPEPVAVAAAEPAVEEPSWTKYLAPEQPAVAVSAPAPLAAEPTAQFIEPAPVPAEPFTVSAPAGVYAGQQPIVIQPIIQPVVRTGQEVLSGQVQAPVAAPMAPVAYTTQPLVTFQPAPYAQTVPAGVPPVMAGSMAMFTTNPLVCGPGQNCFTLPEGQVQGGPQVLTPTASAPLMPLQVAVAPVASLAVPPVAAQDKYAPAASVAAPAVPALPAQRPEVSMPAPLGQTTTPPVAGTDEIENALDVMMGNTPVLK